MLGGSPNKSTVRDHLEGSARRCAEVSSPQPPASINDLHESFQRISILSLPVEALCIREQKKVTRAVLSQFLTHRICQHNRWLFFYHYVVGVICNAALVTGRVPIYFIINNSIYSIIFGLSNNNIINYSILVS